jgi:hypothetical protein
MEPIVDWTRVTVALIRSFFEYLAKKKQSRRGNDGSADTN